MKNALMKKAGLFAVIAMTAFILFSCQNSIGPGGNTPLNNNGQKGNIAGKVVTANNYAVSGVEVSAGSVAAYTNSKGEYYLPNVPGGDRVLVNYRSDGYTSTQKITVVKPNKTSYVDAAVMPIGAQQNLNAAAGGTIQFNNAKVNFPANALVDSKGAPFTKTAQVKATYFDPTSAQFIGCFPGEFTGTRSDNSETIIESFGFMSVEIYNGTEKLQLASNQQSTITFPIPSSILSKAPQTIPLWYYDELKGKWIEEGSALKTGSTYVGTVKHFSNWNCDMPNITSFIEGNVVDKNGTPISFAAVHTTGVDYTGASNGFTDDNGYFKLGVKSSSTAKVWANYHIITSTPQNIATLPTGQIKNIGNIVIPLDSLDFCIIVGRIIDNGNLPVPNITVYQYVKDSAKVIDYVTTNKDGVFKFFGETGKSYTIQIKTYFDSAQQVKTIDVTCPSTPQTIDLGDTKLDIGGSTVIGRVLDVNNNPLVNVFVYSSQGSPNSGQKRESQTDSLGKFSLWVKPNITFSINLYYQGLQKTISATSGNLGDTKDLGDIILP